MTDLNLALLREDRPRDIDDENQTPSQNESQNPVLLRGMKEISDENHGRVVKFNQPFLLIQIPIPHNFTLRKTILQFKTHAHNLSLLMLCSSYLPWSVHLGPQAFHIQVLFRTPQPIATLVNDPLITNMLHRHTITHTHILMILTCLMQHYHPTLLTIVLRPKTPLLPAEEPWFAEVDREVDVSRLSWKKTKIVMLSSCHLVLSV